jgi:iron complex outermembrane receptor protein
MFTNNNITKSVRLALVYGAVATTLSAPAVFAADEDEAEIEKIQVTGSAINRTHMEGALPVDVISKDQIAQSGVGSVPELMETLPSMQGIVTAGESVGGGGGGLSTASLRDLGDQYTLVLLNGRRMASADSGGTVDLNSIPISAIERVEILKDGASALYGSDAIAGVVNFILKKDVTETTVTARYDSIADSGASSFSITTGFGDLDEDGFNIMAAYSRDTKDSLKSVDRDFAKTGFLEFDYKGEKLIGIAGSPNAIPGNVWITHNLLAEDGYELAKNKAGEVIERINGDGYVEVQTLDDEGEWDGGWETKTSSYSFNPYSSKNGSCHTTSAPSATSDVCMFDYTSTLEIQPESVRDNLFLQGLLAIDEDTEAYSTLSYSMFEITSRIAPYPTGFLPFYSQSKGTGSLTDGILASEVMPYVPDTAPANLVEGTRVAGDILAVNGAWRVLPGGNRTTQYDVETTHFVAGVRGVAEEVDYDFSVTASNATRDENRLTGFPITDAFMALATSGAVNIFAAPEDLTDEQRAAVKSTMYSGNQSVIETSMLAFEGKASREMFELPAGPTYLAVGFDYRMASYKDTISDANRDAIQLFESAEAEFDMERDTYGIFGEFVAPITDDLEVTASLRYDSLGAVTTTEREWQETKAAVVDPATAAYTPSEGTYKSIKRKANPEETDTTYKVSFAYRPTDELLIRGAIGTGFKAPSMRELAEPRIEFGVTSVAYDCPEGLPATLSRYCYTDKRQYDVYREGNKNLAPEKSDQMTFGVVWAGDDVSLSVDYWSVEMKDQVTMLTQNQIFGDAATYAERFVTREDNATGETILAIIQSADNVGKSETSGVDYQLNVETDLGFGLLKSQLAGTHMLESKSLRVGSDNIYDDSMGKVGNNGMVTFENIFNITNTLVTGNLTQSLNFRYRSGYTDADVYDSFGVFYADEPTKSFASPEGGIKFDVDAYYVLDYRATYSMESGLDLTIGAKNLLDEEPPLTFNGDAGHQVGYDTRYSDPYGRTIYVSASYTF